MTKQDQEKILSQAKKICQARNVRLTPQREEVLRLVAAQPCAISAYDLLDLLRISEPQAKPPTIYRGLEFLLEQGFIHKIESTNSYVICHHFEDPKHTSVMLICDSCGSVAESNGQTVETAIIKLAKQTGFQLSHTVVESHGLCSPCYKIEKKSC
ncbi:MULTISPECIES: zinc uptake transcriptional repressor Zur [Arsenophonus]|jgi:Fur family transcriptional regulator, zinc uptake regulator|uniref:zinc uptake transcriptional repressor Zur n=1 Tax=Arsenophonus TaxID=637 RepID=UPI0015D7BD9A|nr:MULTISPECIES: zinc uptake transcriptional repressor Zur [Arsenophonus]UBX28921.1 zinc uptake transcriptional repressor Zur [Arsenophonus apicola]